MQIQFLRCIISKLSRLQLIDTVSAHPTCPPVLQRTLTTPVQLKYSNQALPPSNSGLVGKWQERSASGTNAANNNSRLAAEKSMQALVQNWGRTTPTAPPQHASHAQASKMTLVAGSLIGKRRCRQACKTRAQPLQECNTKLSDQIRQHQMHWRVRIAAQAGPTPKSASADDVTIVSSRAGPLLLPGCMQGLTLQQQVSRRLKRSPWSSGNHSETHHSTRKRR